MVKNTHLTPRDHVSRLLEQRRRETPDIPLHGMEVIGRARRLTLLSRPAIEAVFEQYGLDTGEFDVLATLRRVGQPYRLRPTELYTGLMISSGGLTDRLNRLERRSLITREASEEDKRSKLVKLSVKGLELIDRAFREDMEVERRMLASLSESEHRQLAGLLAKLLYAIEKDQIPHD